MQKISIAILLCAKAFAEDCPDIRNSKMARGSPAPQYNHLAQNQLSQQIHINGIPIQLNSLGLPIQQTVTALAGLAANVPLVRTGNFMHDCLQQHNMYRGLIGLPPLQYNKKLASYAQMYANKLANGYAREGTHSDGPYGENYSTSTGGLSCPESVRMWFMEFKYYHGEPISPAGIHRYGHFTQIAWPTTTQVGCAQARGRTGKTIVVCEYDPRGNFDGVSVKVSINANIKIKA